MQKIILLTVCLFAAYWAWQYFINSRPKEPKKKARDAFDESFDDKDGDPDALEAYYERKLAEMEAKAVKKIEGAEESAAYYREKLNKINNLKNK